MLCKGLTSLAQNVMHIVPFLPWSSATPAVAPESTFDPNIWSIDSLHHAIGCADRASRQPQCGCIKSKAAASKASCTGT